MYRSEYGSTHGQKNLCQTGEHKNTDSAVTRPRETKFCCVTDERAAPKKKKHRDLNTFLDSGLFIVFDDNKNNI